MKKISILFLFFSFCFVGMLNAQPGSSYAQDAVERKMDSTYRKQGQKAVRDHVYENDTRFKDMGNRVQATICYMDSSFKKDRLKSVISTKVVFGKVGEAYVTRDESKKQDVYFIFNYADKANYIVNVKDRTAIKMPLINFQKMMEHQQQRAADAYSSSSDGDVGIKATDEYATIAGYNARKYVMKSKDGKRVDMWLSKDVKMNLGDDYMFGSRLNAYKVPSNPLFADMTNSYVVRMVAYDDNDNISMTQTLSEFTMGKADETYFDMSGYKVTDILSGM